MNNNNIVIRSITYTINLSRIRDKEYLSYVENNINLIRKKFEDNKVRIRTIRFNIIALDTLDPLAEDILFENIEKLSKFSNYLGLRWFNISFNLIKQQKSQVDYLCKISFQILEKFENSFINLMVAQEHINNYAVMKSAELIKQVSYLKVNGIDNFRLGVSLNIEPNTPFFPFSYSNKNDSFSIAIESTQSMLASIKHNFDDDYAELKKNIIDDLSNDLVLIDNLSRNLASKYDLAYHGQDISLSPYPDENISVIEILNHLGIDDFGSNGTQFLTSYLTSILKDIIVKTKIKAIGFNGVMYSLLEDKLMCQAHNKKNFSIDSIILYSTVCGCGLDMVPLPGDVLKEEIASMILDVATTSIKLNKPLGVRVLPIQGKKEDEMTELKLDFLTNTQIPKVKYIHVNNDLFNIDEFFIKI
ncbi:MAG: Unknown protein [uncultured Sulfurovum sp.]|uniref:DUF711 domain-containing protein n=1 Tax=uncultured Sulfurovum sp. TaxID=269237 RepID=A0A6S6T5R6_9BACT|nr:MAG: Unknown protein [uncultured Sulfurovum sp.]